QRSSRSNSRNLEHRREKDGARPSFSLLTANARAYFSPPLPVDGGEIWLITRAAVGVGVATRPMLPGVFVGVGVTSGTTTSSGARSQQSSPRGVLVGSGRRRLSLSR